MKLDLVRSLYVWSYIRVNVQFEMVVFIHMYLTLPLLGSINIIS